MMATKVGYHNPLSVQSAGDLATVVLLGFFCLVGVVINGILLHILRSSRYLRDAYCLLLANMATSSALQTIAFLPVILNRVITVPENVVLYTTCQAQSLVFPVLGSLVVLLIERYCFICHALTYSERLWRIVTIVSIFASWMLAVCLPSAIVSCVGMHCTLWNVLPNMVALVVCLVAILTNIAIYRASKRHQHGHTAYTLGSISPLAMTAHIQPSPNFRFFGNVAADLKHNDTTNNPSFDSKIATRSVSVVTGTFVVQEERRARKSCSVPNINLDLTISAQLGSDRDASILFTRRSRNLMQLEARGPISGPTFIQDPSADNDSLRSSSSCPPANYDDHETRFAHQRESIKTSFSSSPNINVNVAASEIPLVVSVKALPVTNLSNNSWKTRRIGFAGDFISLDGASYDRSRTEDYRNQYSPQHSYTTERYLLPTIEDGPFNDSSSTTDEPVDLMEFLKQDHEQEEDSNVIEAVTIAENPEKIPHVSWRRRAQGIFRVGASVGLCVLHSVPTILGLAPTNLCVLPVTLFLLFVCSATHALLYACLHRKVHKAVRRFYCGVPKNQVVPLNDPPMRKMGNTPV